MKLDIRAKNAVEQIAIRGILERCLIQNFYYEIFVNAMTTNIYCICYHKKGYHSFRIDLKKECLF